ncbi:MAG: VWA domain-containing protein [Armatimonadetes bacterium]|nr:VWA domain-containing protein [Armatimonadota bacterium]
MKKDYTHITLVLDRSGSMEQMRTDAIGGFNTFLKDQQAAPGAATLTLVQFDDRYESSYSLAPIASVKPLDTTTFVPRGSTALLDALGKAIEETGARLAAMPDDERPEKVLFVTLTDGMENASRIFTRAQIFDKITHQRDVYDWEFVFLAANQDAIEAGETMGFARDSSATYAATGKGQQSAMQAVSQATTRYRMIQKIAPTPGKPPAPKPAFFDAADRAVIEEGNK